MSREVAPLREYSGQEGSRWINERPSGEQVAHWFEGIKLHEGMEHERYVSGITLISAREEFDAVVDDGNGPRIAKRSQIVYTPYPKVDARNAYFLDWKALHPEYVGWVEPVDVRRQPMTQFMPSNEGMPPGFFYTAARTEKGITVYLCSTQRVVVYEAQSYADRARGRDPVPVIQAEGTKAVPVLRYSDRADDNAVMKAETGAKGRALGFAGMLVIPGAGVATAEDMQEAQAADQRPAADTAIPPGELPPSSPEDAAQAQRSEDADLRDAARARISLLQSDFPERWNEVAEWAREREFKSLDALDGPALKGFVRKLDKVVDEAKGAQQERGEGNDPLQEAMAPEEPPEVDDA